MVDSIQPDYARTVLVPVANPSNARSLLQLALELVAPEDGRVIALLVSLGDAESDAKTFAAIKPICDELIQAGNVIKLQSEASTSISRGILDTARESGADLLILGIKRPTRGQVVLGTIAENVLQAAPCDVLIYRAAQNTPDYNRVIVPIDEHSHTGVAAKLGIWLAHHHRTDIEAYYVRQGGQQYYQAMAHIEFALRNVYGQEIVKRSVIDGGDTADAILARTGENDMIVAGFDDRNDLERWMFGDASRKILNRATGPVILVSRSPVNQTSAGRVSRRMLGWLRPTLTRIEQEELLRQAQENASMTLDYTVLIVISALLASLGLLLNSAAVIIGAMLVAPLMQPLLAFGATLVGGRFVIVQRSAISLGLGIVIAFTVAYITGALSGVVNPTPEMMARGSPSLLDAFVALASGVVGAYATARKDIPAALAGVAIAAALMPPLCTVALGLSIGNIPLATGSGLLFLTNILSIILAGTIVYYWLGVQAQVSRLVRPAQLFILGTLVGLVGLVVVQLYTSNLGVNDVRIVRQELTELLSPAQIVDIDMMADSDPISILVTIRLEDDLSAEQYHDAKRQIETTLQRPVIMQIIPQKVLVYPPDTDPASQAIETASGEGEATELSVNPDGTGDD